MLRGCEAGHRPDRSLGEPTLRGLSAAAKNAEADFHCCGSSQERPRQGPARPPAGGLDRAHEGVCVSVYLSTFRWLTPPRELSCRAKSACEIITPHPEERPKAASRRMDARQ